MSFRAYVTDALQIIAENTARIGGGRTISRRWADVVGGSRNAPADDRTPEEIIADVAEKAGLTITHEHI